MFCYPNLRHLDPSTRPPYVFDTRRTYATSRFRGSTFTQPGPSYLGFDIDPLRRNLVKCYIWTTPMTSFETLN